MSSDGPLSRHPYLLAALAAFVCLSLPVYLLVRGTPTPIAPTRKPRPG